VTAAQSQAPEDSIVIVDGERKETTQVEGQGAPATSLKMEPAARAKH
jgi:hypothetical protein